MRLALLCCVALSLVVMTNCCNEAVCASIVSKCMLTQSCKCDDFKLNKTCSRDCYLCLDYLYQDCCSCVEMCPKPNVNESSLASKSHVEELTEPQPDLFLVLTEEKDHLLRWTSYSMPVKVVMLSSLGSESHKEVKYASKVTKSESDGIDREEDAEVNCTVAYMSQCMSWNKCKSSCTSMGANSYRWFHDGCCECVGIYCINYGINESRCLQCPITAEEDVDMNIDDEPNGNIYARSGEDDDEEGSNEDDDLKTGNTLSDDKKEKESKTSKSANI